MKAETPGLASSTSTKGSVNQSERSSSEPKLGARQKKQISRSNRKLNNSKRINIQEIHFDPKDEANFSSWHKYAENILCVNAYPNGISVSQHEQVMSADEEMDSKKDYVPWQFHLRLRDMREFRLPVGKYYLYKDSIRASLKKHLSQLYKSGKLANTVVYFGTISDPFLSFQKKFEVTMACLELFEQFKPAKLVIQTRSPMVISALPMLKSLGDRAVVTVGVETISEEAVRRYSPGQPKISERFVAASGLRRQGIKVNLLVSPTLPYGDFYRDAWNFAELLDNYGDYITFGSLAYGTQSEERQLRELALAKRLASDKKYHWLRPYSYRNVFRALTVLSPEKLNLPVEPPKSTSQLDLFAA